MPLVTRSNFNAQVFRQADEPSDWVNGDIWVDTDNGKAYTNNSGTAQAITTNTARGIAIY